MWGFHKLIRFDKVWNMQTKGRTIPAEGKYRKYRNSVGESHPQFKKD